MKSFDSFSDMLSIKDICEILDISRYTAYKLIRNKKIKYVKIGNKFLIPKKPLCKFLGAD